MGFFSINVTDDYVENNYVYAEEYKRVLNKNIKYGNGYVSLSRILEFYIEDNNLSFEELYKDNLDIDTKQQKSLYEVCQLDKYKIMSKCKTDEISDVLVNRPFNFPLDISNLNITSFFMEERIVYDKFNVHGAWDFAAPDETKVYSVCDGKVIDLKFNYKNNLIDKNGGYGNYIKLECEVDNIKYEVIYGHLYPNSTTLKVGDNVKHFDIIASVGTTGYSTGSHLHFEVHKDNKKIDGVSLINFTYET